MLALLLFTLHVIDIGSSCGMADQCGGSLVDAWETRLQVQIPMARTTTLLIAKGTSLSKTKGTWMGGMGNTAQ